MSSSSSGSSEGEWEDVESFPPGKIQHFLTSLHMYIRCFFQLKMERAASPPQWRLCYQPKALFTSIVCSASCIVSHDCTVNRGKRKNALEKAMEAFDRELRYGLHKTSLLCLLGQGLWMNTASCNPLLQARLLSLVPRELHLSTSGKLYKVLKWFVARKDHISTALKDDGETEGGSLEVPGVSLSPVQLLVAVLRILGLRARLVLAFNPISFRPSRPKNTDSLTIRDTDISTREDTGGGELSETKSALLEHRGEDSAPQPGPHFFRLMEQLKQSAGREASMDGSSEAKTEEEGGGESGRRGRGREKRRSSESVESGIGKRRKLSCGNVDTPEKYPTPPNKSSETKTAGSKGKGKQRKDKRTPTTASETSPYFSSQGKTSCGASNTDGGSGSDSDFVPPKRKAKRLLFGSSSEGSEGESGEREKREKGETGKKRGKGKSPRGAPQKNQNVSKKVELMTRRMSAENTTQTGVYGKIN